MGAWEDRDGFAARQPERRSDPRYSVDEDSVVLFVGYGAPRPARLVDLSQEGCRLRTDEPVSARARLPVEVFFKINGISFRFRGVLQWTDARNLLGIRFVNMIPLRMVELANVICGMEETVDARAEAVKLMVAEQEAPQPPRRERKTRATRLAMRCGKCLLGLWMPAAGCGMRCTTQPTATARPGSSFRQPTLGTGPATRTRKSSSRG